MFLFIINNYSGTESLCTRIIIDNKEEHSICLCGEHAIRQQSYAVSVCGFFAVEQFVLTKKVRLDSLFYSKLSYGKKSRAV